MYCLPLSHSFHEAVVLSSVHLFLSFQFSSSAFLLQQMLLFQVFFFLFLLRSAWLFPLSIDINTTEYIYECYSLKRLNVVSLLYYTASNGNFTFLKRKMAFFQVASYTCTSIHNNATYSDRALQGLIIQTAL